MESQDWENCFVSGQNWQPFFPQCLFVGPISASIPLPAFCPLFRDWQELSGGDSALTLILLFPFAIFFGFTILVGGFWGEHTSTSWFKGNMKYGQTEVCSRRKSGRQSIDLLPFSIQFSLSVGSYIDWKLK